MTELGPAISFRGPFPERGGKFTGVYALAGDKHWRTLQFGEAPVLFDSAREAEAAAGHMLCAKLRQMPIDIQEPLRTEIQTLLNDLVDWNAFAGERDAAVWRRLEKLRERLRDQRSQHDRLLGQLRSSLSVYRERGEFDGGLASARACLEQAEFEWTPDVARAVTQIIGEARE